MATIAVLEGYDYDEMLGWGVPKFVKKIGRSVKKVTRPITRPVSRITRKVTRPIRRITRPVTRPLDRILKKTPVVRSVYRSAIASTYTATGQFSKVPGAFKRAGRSVIKDVGFLRRQLKGILRPLVRSLAGKYSDKIPKTGAKAIVIPSAMSLASAKLPPAVPYVPVVVNELINELWRRTKRVSSRIARRTISRFQPSRLRMPSSPFKAQKMPFIPSVQPKPFANPFQQQAPPPAPEPTKSAINPALLALPLVALMMG